MQYRCTARGGAFTPFSSQGQLLESVQPPGGGFIKGSFVMNIRLSRASLLAAVCLAFSGAAAAQSPNGFSSIIHVPVVVNSAAFSSTIFVHNPGGSAIDVQFDYTGAEITASAGPLDCGSHSIPAGSTVEFDFAALCPLTGVSNFGSMRIHETSPINRPIAVYTRVQSPVAGNGFSIEGFPVGGFADDQGASVAVGLKRSAVLPGYQSNCFVGSIGEAVAVDVALYDSANTQIGTTQTIAVPAGGLTRMLDVFAVSGAPDGDYANVRAEFHQNAEQVGNPSFSAFCTVQNNTTFDADFRIAKTVLPDDLGQQYTSTVNKDAFGANQDIPAGQKVVYAMFVKHPDFLSCRVIGDGQPNAELRVLRPNGTVAAGGDDINDTGEFFTGEKSTVNNGTNGLWRVEVGARDGAGLAASNYNLQCRSGNGMSKPIVVAVLADDF